LDYRTDLDSEEELRRRIVLEREALASSVDDLRGELSLSRSASALEGRLAPAVGVAAAIGFVVAGGPGAAMRLAATSRRPGRTVRLLRALA
jgi:hypothetical protein